MTTQFRLIIALVMAAILVGGCLWFRSHYIGVGVAQEQARHNAVAVESLTNLINSHKALIQEAYQASLEMQAALNARSRADAETTRSLKNALSKTASSRAGCVFDANSLRELDDARARSAKAASSGIRRTSPGATTPLRGHPG